MKTKLAVFFNFFVCNLLLRFVRTRTGVAIIKRAAWLDLRVAWNYERLRFVYSKDLSESQKIKRVRLYYLLTPKKRGISWACGMESAFRLSALLDLSKDGKCDVNEWLKYEYEFLKNNIEWGSGNNHLLLCLVVAHVYGKIKAKDDAFHNDLCREIERQFNPDGSNFEGATGYHILALSSLFWLKNWLPDDAHIFDRINYIGAMQFAKLILEPQNWAWIGDNDSSILGDESSFFSAIKETSLRNGEYFFPDFSAVVRKAEGYIFSLWGADYKRLGHAGHKHDDWGTVTFAVNEEPLLVDAGVYSYSWDRESLRSRAAHNVVNVPDVKIIRYHANFRGDSNFEVVTRLSRHGGECNIYNKKNIIISRKVAWSEDKIKVFDSVKGRARSCWIINSEAWDVKVSDGRSILVFISKTSGREIVMELQDVTCVDVSEFFWCPKYFSKSKGKRVTVSFEKSFSWSISL
ncbi:heparinase II/III domain-containing protein [Alloalcanivorax xenomutans]|uniref:heparinase II/III domain-containing protein n=1 Tax=Alloalcanivorax xenomutans TaxID=1094342 RepID=UPI000BE3E2D1|nr:heparinase II/III family protein [Alloalcanivorax xenomutans]